MKTKKIVIYLFIITTIILTIYLAIELYSTPCGKCNKKYRENFSDESKRIFMTFGTKDRFKKSLVRIKNEAESMQVFDDYYVYNEDDLKSDAEFWNKHGKFIESNPRGYGYWIWKSYLILKTLRMMKDGDILLYCDSGSTLRPNGRPKLLEYMEHCVQSKTGIFCFQLEVNHEKQWTKMDLLDKMDMHNQYYLDSIQIAATNIIFCKRAESIQFVEKWHELCVSDNYMYVTDEPSKSQNDQFFVEHRHDQSIFSLSVKKDDGCFVLKTPDTEKESDDSFPIYNSRIRE